MEVDLQSKIVDLDNNGQKEIIITNLITEYRGCGIYAVWNAIYKIENGVYIQSDSDFPEYYTNIFLPEIEKEINDINNKKIFVSNKLKRGDEKVLYRFYLNNSNQIPDKDDRELDIVEREMILSFYYLPYDKVYRITNINSKAGLERAIKWANSNNIILRKNSLIVFQDIGDKDSIIQVERLSEDKNKEISIKAKKILGKINN